MRRSVRAFHFQRHRHVGHGAVIEVFKVNPPVSAIKKLCDVHFDLAAVICCVSGCTRTIPLAEKTADMEAHIVTKGRAILKIHTRAVVIQAHGCADVPSLNGAGFADKVDDARG